MMMASIDIGFLFGNNFLMHPLQVTCKRLRIVRWPLLLGNFT